MSTFLQLVETFHKESGASGDAPLGVTSQEGEAQRFVDWVKLEWRKLQNRHSNWRWMRKKFTLTTIANDDTYAYSDCIDVSTSLAISRFGRWYTDRFKIYLQSAGVGTEGWLNYLPWDDFEQVYKLGSVSPSMPVAISVDPDNNLVLGPEPPDVYIITGDYHRDEQALAADGDTPEMPARFHDLIWLGALRRYGAYEGDPSVWAEAKAQHSELMRALEQDQLPPPGFAGPLC